MEKHANRDEEAQHLVPGTHPDDVELDVAPPQATTDGRPLPIRLDPPVQLSETKRSWPT